VESRSNSSEECIDPRRRTAGRTVHGVPSLTCATTLPDLVRTLLNVFMTVFGRAAIKYVYSDAELGPTVLCYMECNDYIRAHC
jgi:hypothetical protein